jgi:hypothetical protein
MPNIPKMGGQQFKLWKGSQTHLKKQEKWLNDKLGDR